MKTLLISACCLVGVAAFALNPKHLDEMPDIARALADVKGADRADTLARQAERRALAAAPSEPGFKLFDERWPSLSPDEKEREILVWSVLASLLAFALVSLLVLPFDINPRNIERLRSGLRRYKVRFRTGRLVDYSTEVSGSSTTERVMDGGYRKDKITSSSTFLDETLTLVDADGSVTFNVRSDQSGYSGGRRTEESGYFYGREGLEFTAVWITTRFRKKFVGHLLFFCAEPRLKITGTFSSKAIARARGSQRWSYWVALVLGFAVGGQSDVPLGYILGAIVFVVAWAILRGVISGRSQRRFEAREIPRLFEHVEALHRRGTDKG